MESKLNDIVLGTGTCFFVQRQENIYLITNWHIVSGLNSQNRECLDKHGRLPNKLLVRIFNNSEFIEWDEFELNLFDENENPVWIEHPSHGRLIDVVAIRVHIPQNQLVIPIEEMVEPFNENTKLRVSDDVYILGFPFSIKYAGNFPIWKRASIASEPNIDIDDLPKIFVDTASREGMSGSPVILKNRRPIAPFELIAENLPFEKGNIKKISYYYIKLVGIYSGRTFVQNESDAQLGIVWKVDVIDEIIGHPDSLQANLEDQTY